MRKIALPMLMLLAMVFTACAPAATPTPEVVVELTQVTPTQRADRCYAHTGTNTRTDRSTIRE